MFMNIILYESFANKASYITFGTITPSTIIYSMRINTILIQYWQASPHIGYIPQEHLPTPFHLQKIDICVHS